MNLNEECLLKYLNNPGRLCSLTEKLKAFTNPIKDSRAHNKIQQTANNLYER